MRALLLVLAACASLPYPKRVELGAAQTYSMTRRATVCSPIAEIGARWAVERAEAECVAGGLPKTCYVGDVLLVEGAFDHRWCGSQP